MPRDNHPYIALNVDPTNGAVNQTGLAKYSAGYDLTTDGYNFAHSWDWSQNKLRFQNDWLGIATLFYCVWDGGIVVSTSLYKVAEFCPDRTFDDDAIALWLRFGHFFGDDTPFKNIRCVPADVVIDWEPMTGIQVTASKRKTTAFTGSRKEAFETYGALFKDAVLRRAQAVNGDIILPLSGGRDSRHILLELDKNGILPNHILTMINEHPGGQEDVRVATLLAEEFKLDMNVHEINWDQYFSYVEKKNETCEYLGVGHTTSEAFKKKIPPITGTIFDGFAGGVVSHRFGLDLEVNSLLAKGQLDDAARILLSRRAIPSVLTSSLKSRYSHERSVAHLIHHLKPYIDEVNPMMAFFFHNHSRRMIGLSPFRVLGDLNLATPFVDRSLVDFTFSVPRQTAGEGSFHEESIAMHYPDYAHIPYESKKLGSNSVPLSSFKYSLKAMKHILDGGSLTAINPLRLSRSFLQAIFAKEPAKVMWWTEELALYQGLLKEINQLSNVPEVS